MERKEKDFVEVPSLYVRVYRRRAVTDDDRAGSFTICEGISAGKMTRKRARKFPHYT